MKFFCLNIDSAIDRRQHCDREFAKAGIDVMYVSAFETRRNNIRHTNPHYKIGHLGCYLSHLRLMEEIRRYDYSPAMIFEDDVWLADDFKTRLDEAMLTLPDDWEVAFVGWWPEHFNYEQLRTEHIGPHWQRMVSGVLWGCHCYMVNGKKGGDKLMKILQPITGHVDDVLLWAIVQGHIKGYFLQQPLADQTGTFKSQTNA